MPTVEEEELWMMMHDIEKKKILHCPQNFFLFSLPRFAPTQRPKAPADCCIPVPKLPLLLVL